MKSRSDNFLTKFMNAYSGPVNSVIKNVLLLVISASLIAIFVFDAEFDWFIVLGASMVAVTQISFAQWLKRRYKPDNTAIGDAND